MSATPIDTSSLTLLQLKSLWFDEWRRFNLVKNNLELLQKEIDNKEKVELNKTAKTED